LLAPFLNIALFLIDNSPREWKTQENARIGRSIMSEPERIGPKETHEKLKAGTVLLVCAYDSDEKFKAMPLEGAISLSAFQSRFPALSKDQEIIFYCA
jgi:hypothetical protein